ncbi:MAG: CBS domain-containing protein [Symbiobacterium sp.]|uniref:CBS domain-containing protein n=1 Tax=Symbiobacterium sp. TaxID=1971213 RepID=UPI003463927B
MTAERFLRAYNRIDDHLRSLLDIDRSRFGFASVVDQAAKRYSVVRRYADDLKEFGALRNAIVHDREFPARIIADPRPEVVEAIERLADIIIDPPRVYPLFQREVRRLGWDDPIQKPLRWIRKYHYTQFPVFRDRRFAGLLTSRCVAQWLADSVQNGGIDFGGVTVGDVLRHDEYGGRRVAFVARDATWYDAVELFSPARGKRSASLEAILITESGREDEELLGIITPRDLLNPPAGVS